MFGLVTDASPDYYSLMYNPDFFSWENPDINIMYAPDQQEVLHDATDVIKFQYEIDNPEISIAVDDSDAVAYSTGVRQVLTQDEGILNYPAIKTAMTQPGAMSPWLLLIPVGLYFMWRR